MGVLGGTPRGLEGRGGETSENSRQRKCHLSQLPVLNYIWPYSFGWTCSVKTLKRSTRGFDLSGPRLFWLIGSKLVDRLTKNSEHFGQRREEASLREIKDKKEEWEGIHQKIISSN